MFTDMVGYSALAQRNDLLALQLLDEHRTLLRGMLPRFNGAEIKTIGDAFLIEFRSALEAAQCGIEIQRALAKRNHDVTPDRRIELRIGIHIGDVVHRDGDVYGDGVNIAARIEPLAKGGGICVSMDVERQVRNALEARLEKLGQAELKNIKLPMDVYRVVLPWETTAALKDTVGASRPKKPAAIAAIAAILAGVILLAGAAVILVHWPKGEHTATASRGTNPPGRAETGPEAGAPGVKVDPKSIAVLPFANLSSEKENEFFVDGLHDDVITSLAKIRDLTVISRTSVLAYRDPGSRNLRKIASELGVANVLEGSVRRVGKKVHINAQLIDARTDTHLWADTFDGDAADQFALQAALAKQIAAALKASMTGAEEALIRRKPTQSREAYDVYLQARLQAESLNRRMSVSDYERVIGHFEEAARLDPTFALPHLQEFLLHGELHWFASLDPSPERQAKAREQLEDVLRLAPGSPEAHLAQGIYQYDFENDWAAALSEFRLAEEGLPNDSLLLQRIGLTQRRLGLFDEAVRSFERAVQISPTDARSLGELCECLFFLRRYTVVLTIGERITRTTFASPGTLSQIAEARLALDGDWNAYLLAIGALQLSADDPDGLIKAYRLASLRGDLPEAERILEDPRIKAVPGTSAVMSEPVALHRALVAWLQGRPDDARKFAEEALAVLQAGRWLPRQKYWVELEAALADALAGRSDKALQEARSALDGQNSRDRFEGVLMANRFGMILLICNQREKALEFLQNWLKAPGGLSAGLIRHNPYWSRLKDEPGFEEILKSARAL